MKMHLVHFWSNLSERDKLVLSIGGAICCVYLLYLLIFSPLRHAVDTRANQWIEKTETLAWMRSQAKTKQSPKQAGSNLLLIFSKQLKSATFAHFHSQLQQAGENRVQLSFEEVPYADFLKWLRLLNEQYFMAITELSVVRSETPGVVKLRVVVENQVKGFKK